MDVVEFLVLCDEVAEMALQDVGWKPRLPSPSCSSEGASTPISPATYLLTPLTLVAAAAFWILVPPASFLYLAVRRD